MITISAIEPFSSFSHTTNIQSFHAILSIASQRKSTHMESPLDRLRSISLMFWVLLTKRRVQEIQKRQGETGTFDRKLGITMLVEHAKGLIMLCIILSLLKCKNYMNSLPFLQLTTLDCKWMGWFFSFPQLPYYDLSSSSTNAIGIIWFNMLSIWWQLWKLPAEVSHPRDSENFSILFSYLLSS